MVNESASFIDSAMEEGAAVSFLMDNLVPVMVTTGCITVGLLGALIAIKKESKRRTEVAPAPEEPSREETVDRAQYPGGKLTVYYATQTGTAESFAKELEREAKDHGFLVKIEDVEDLDAQPTSIVDAKKRSPFGADTRPGEMPRCVVLAATYGEGEPTDTTMTLYNEMQELLSGSNGGDDGGEEKRSDDEPPLKGLEYAVFGLGNREYEIFNAMGKFFDGALEKLGGDRVHEMGLGDDSDDLEADFEKWKEGLWASLKTKYVKEGSVAEAAAPTDAAVLPDCQYRIEWQPQLSRADASNADETRASVSPTAVHGSSKNFFSAVDCPVTLVKELRTKADGGSTVHVEIDISNASATTNNNLKEYRTADNLGVFPVNSRETVESVAKSLGHADDLDKVFTLATGTDRDGNPHSWNGLPFPTPITVRECLTRYLDLTSAPRRSDLKLLSSYARQTVDRKALQRLSSKEAKAEYREKIVEGRVGLAQLLELCPSIEIPLEHLIGNVCRFSLPRYYTIASCPKVVGESIHLTVAVTKDERKNGTFFNGVCSTHIADATNPSLRVFVRPSTFRLPPSLDTPVLMIGPGTGIAPMRALLQDRKHQYDSEGGETAMRNILYFGCKKEDRDYIYRDELEAFRDEGTLEQLHVAFSRRDPAEKVYVQHLLKRNAAATYEILEDGAYVFVCGGTKMGHDVSETFKDILASEGSMSRDDAANYVSNLSSQGRYVQELWS